MLEAETHLAFIRSSVGQRWHANNWVAATDATAHPATAN